MERKVVISCSQPQFRKTYENVDVERLQDIINLLTNDNVVVDFNDYTFYEGTTRSEFVEPTAILPLQGEKPDLENPNVNIPTTELWFRLVKKASKTESAMDDFKKFALRYITENDLRDSVISYLDGEDLLDADEDSICEAIYILCGVELKDEFDRKEYMERQEKQKKFEETCFENAKLYIDSLSEEQLIKEAVLHLIFGEDRKMLNYIGEKIRDTYKSKEEKQEDKMFDYLNK